MTDQRVPVLRWEDTSEGPAVVLLDQTRLPGEEVGLVCADVPALVAAIRDLSVRGAPLLGIAGAYGVALAAGRGTDVAEAAEELAYARPTAVNLAVGARRAEHAYRFAVDSDGAGEERAAAAALAEAEALHREEIEAGGRMAEEGRALLDELLPGGRLRILTHCNTGTLVSGGPGTAFGVIAAVHRAGGLRRLWVDETRPLLQGARLTAYEAERERMPYRVLPDSAAGSLFATGEVDAVLIGADRIAADGSVANKVGSFPLAVLADYHRVPFVVVAPVSTVDVATERGADIEVEQRPGSEVTDFSGPFAEPYAGVQTQVHGLVPAGQGLEAGSGSAAGGAPLGAQAYNPAFDVTPPELVTAIVTERGVISPVTAENVAAVRSGLCLPSPTEAPGVGNGMMSP